MMGSRLESDVASLPQPWLRQAPKGGKDGATESAKAYAALQLYYLTSPNLRSLKQVALQLKKSETLMEGWSTNFGWVRRTEAWDRHQSQLAAAEYEKTRREKDAKWAAREEELYEQDYAASREMVARGVQSMKLPLTEKKLQKTVASGNQTIIIKPANRGQSGVTELIRGGHEIGLDCIKHARPEAAAVSTEDDYEFVPLIEPEKEGGEE
jgi:hypothetical protein